MGHGDEFSWFIFSCFNPSTNFYLYVNLMGHPHFMELRIKIAHQHSRDMFYAKKSINKQMNK